MDSLVIDIQSTSTDATKSIDTLITRLSSLRDVLKEVSTASNGLSNLKKIGNGVRTSSSSKIPKIEQPKMLYKNIDVRPAFEKIAGDIGKVDSATSMLRNKFNTLGISLKDTKIIDTFSDGNKVITKYATKTGSVIIVIDKLRGAFGKADVSVKKTNTSTKKFSDDFKKTTDIINKVNVALLGAVAGFARLARKMGDFVNQAGAEQEALNLFTVTMGQYAKQGVEWIERFSDALYLDPVSVMQYMGSFNSLVKGLGVGAENSYKMSQNLTQLVYDLASFKNITVTSAYEKLMSGISGELEPLRNVGVAMSEATLQTLAYELGIEKLVRNMTEAEKAQLRYIQIMRSSTEWQTDMGRTLITPTNALRVMRQQFVQLGRAIGKVFIPIVMELMPYVIALTQMLTALAQKIANFLGYEIADIDYSSLGDISAGITDIGDSADKTAEKLNTMLAPFDNLNVVQSKSKSASDGIGGMGGDLGIDLPEYDALANLNEKFAEGVERAKKNLEKILPIVTAIGGAFALWKISNGVLKFITGANTTVKGFEKIYKAIKKIKGTQIVAGLKKFVTIATKVSGVLVGLITTVMGGNGVYNTLKKLGNGAKFTAEAFWLLTGNIAEVTAGTALAGLAIGGPLGAGIGALTGLVISGISAWAGYRKGLTELAESKVFGDIHISTEQFSKALNGLQLSFTGTNKVISEYNEKMAGLGSNFEKSSQSVDSYLAKFQYLNESISGETGEAFKTALDTLFKDANAIIETGTQYSLDLWMTSFKSMTSLTAEEQGNVLKIVQDNGTYVSSEMAKAQNKITEIYNTGMQTRGYLTQEEINTIQSMLNRIRELTGQEMTKTQADIEYYKKIFGDKNYKLDKESYDNYLKARKEYEKEQKEIIKENYTTQYAEAQKQIDLLKAQKKTADADEKKELQKKIDEMKAVQKTSYDERLKAEKELAKELEKTDKTITENLKKQYQEIQNETDKSAKEQRKIIEGIFKKLNIDTADLKKQMKTSGSMCAKTFGEEFNKKQLQLKINPNNAIGFTGATMPFKASWYAEGGYPSSGELFFANENGVPEMVGRIGNQTAVANNDQITASITTALLSALDQYNFGGGNSPTTIYIGNRKVYEGYGDYVADENDRYGTNMIKI